MGKKQFLTLSIFLLVWSAACNLVVATELSALDYDGQPTAVGDGTPRGTQYRLFDMYGGTWHDAEKSSDNSEDDLLCWAAQASNLLSWTGLGKVDGMTTTDEIFQYFQDHWTDNAGNSYFGLDWWFDGTNDMQGNSGWAQVDVPGGGFWPDLNIDHYRHWTSNDQYAMAYVDNNIKKGWATGLTLAGPGGHAVTCWGFNVNPNNDSDYYGVWLTDSDDDKGGSAPQPDNLRYYDISLTDGAWYLQDYYNTNNWYISEVIGLEPIEIPEPASLVLLLFGGMGIIWRKGSTRN